MFATPPGEERLNDVVKDAAATDPAAIGDCFTWLLSSGLEPRLGDTGGDDTGTLEPGGIVAAGDDERRRRNLAEAIVQRTHDALASASKRSCQGVRVVS